MLKTFIEILQIIGWIVFIALGLFVGAIVSALAMTIGSDSNAARWARLLGPQDKK